MIDARGLLERRALASLSDVEVLRLQALSRPGDSLLAALAFMYALPEDTLLLHSSRDALRMRQSFVLVHRSFALVAAEAVPVHLERVASLQDWLDWVGAELPAPPVLTHLRNISQAGRAPHPPLDAVPGPASGVLAPWPVLAPLPPSGAPAGEHGAAPRVTHSRTGGVDVAHAHASARVDRVTFEGGIACCESAEHAVAYLTARRLSASARALAADVRELRRVARLNAPKCRTRAEQAARALARQRRLLARRALPAQATAQATAQAAPASRRVPAPATFGPSGTVHALPWPASAPAQAVGRPAQPDTAAPAATPTGALSTRPARHEALPTQKRGQKAQAQAGAPRHTAPTPTPTPQAVSTRATPGECKPAPPQPSPPAQRNADERRTHYRKFTLDGSAQAPLRQPLKPQDMTDAQAAHALITYLIGHQAWTIDRAVRLHVPISDAQLARVRQGRCAPLLSTQTVAGQAQYRLTATDAARDAQLLSWLARFKTATLPVVIAEQLHMPLAEILPSLRRLTARGDLHTVTGQQGGYRVPDGHPIPDLAAQLLALETP